MLIKVSLQRHIHFTGNIFGNKWYRYNEGPLYFPSRIDPFQNYKSIFTELPSLPESVPVSF